MIGAPLNCAELVARRVADYRRRVPGEVSPGAWRISDLDRDNAARLLATAMEQGRLTPIEYSDRCQAAYAARTRDELLEVLADLPGGPEAGLAPLVLNVPFGQVRRTGQWAIPELVRSPASASAPCSTSTRPTCSAPRSSSRWPPP